MMWCGLTAVLFGSTAVTAHRLGTRAPFGVDNAAEVPRQQAAGTRILLFYDMEGASGVLGDSAQDPGNPEAFAKGRASLTQDVNTVVAGLFDGGASAVHVRNAHGFGGDSLVPRNALDGRAEIVSGQERHPYNPGGSVATLGYNAVVTVAMHDKPQSGGYSPHTIGAGISPIINGAAVTETELIGYAYGVGGLPVIFSSGDDRLQRSLAVCMPWVEYVTVKRISSPTVPEPRPTEEVQRDLRSAAARAVRDLQTPGRKHVMRLVAPFRAGLLPTYPRLLPPGIGTIPGLERRGDTVTFVASDYRSAYLGFFALQRISYAFYREQILFELTQRPGIDSAYRAVLDSFTNRWMAFEQGKWKPQ